MPGVEEGYSPYECHYQKLSKRGDTMVLGIMGILLSDRRGQAPDVQEILTKYGDLIQCRTGVHDAATSVGLITLTVEADREELHALTAELKDVSGVDVSTALFEDRKSVV